MVQVRALLLATLVAATLISGCTGPDGPDGRPSPDTPSPTALDLWRIYLDDRATGGALPPPRIQDPGRNGTGVVVAVIDSGVDPFHRHFARPDLLHAGTSPVAAIDSMTGEAPLYVPIPLLAEADGSDWMHSILAPKTLYRFAGTDLLYYSVLDNVSALDADGHGTATAGLVAENAPEATIVLVQTGSGHLEAAIEWAVAQPWIDVLSVSWGCGANCAWYAPLAKTADPLDVEREIKATRAAWDAGKLVVFSAGNDPTLQTTDYHDGPPWIVSVGGADPYRRGEAWIASKAPDVLANFTGIAPARGTGDGYVAVPGTSFAAPVVSGVLAESIRRLRYEHGHSGGISDGALVSSGSVRLTNADLRDAMNRSAVYWTTTDYDATADHPAKAPADPLFAADAGIPINPAAPWLQMGWGYVDGTIADTMVEGLLSDTLPDKPAEAKRYREQVQAARTALWD